MTATTPSQMRGHLAALKAANDFEREELRAASLDLKLRQTSAMMGAARLQHAAEEREAEIRIVRDRWARIHRALNV